MLIPAKDAVTLSADGHTQKWGIEQIPPVISATPPW
jgi:hypothetical protein